jgi:hypothetical protein
VSSPQENAGLDNLIQFPYVFESLRSAGVANFTFDGNWRSGLRNHVRILPEYQDEPDWRAREVSVIMYEGNCHRLMAFLRNHTVDSYPQWLKPNTISTPVNFYMEVKATNLGAMQHAILHEPEAASIDARQENACDPVSSEPPPRIYSSSSEFLICSPAASEYKRISTRGILESIPYRLLPMNGRSYQRRRIGQCGRVLKCRYTYQYRK